MEDKKNSGTEEPVRPSNFIREIVAEDVKQNKNGGKVVTRFPPEPNGHLHIGHAKAFSIDFGIAREFNGRCHLRFDDTNPSKEKAEYTEAIQEIIRWLGFDWGEHLYFASDYYEKICEYAIRLIKDGKAYVCHLSVDEIREYRGTLTKPGRESPYRNRAVAENLELFEKMKSGGFKDGECVLRAKIDMASPNINMRDPVLYRIMRLDHHRTGGKWCIYPMYDFAHPLSDAIEGITHSLCSLEYEDHRPLYDWFIGNCHTEAKPHQYEFARLNMTWTVMSKRLLLQLVEKGIVKGWDDPRMPTLAGMRRRGYTPAAILDFLDRIGVAKSNSTVEIGLLEHCVREDLNKKAPRVMTVLRPLKLVITDWPKGKVEMLEAENNPEDPSAGKRLLPFSGVLYVEEDDFQEIPQKKWFRLTPGAEVRLKFAYYVTCTGAVKDSSGKIVELHCTHDPESKGGGTKDNRRVQGTLHWVSAAHAADVDVRIYEHLFVKPDPENVPEGQDFMVNVNDHSFITLNNCKSEPSLKEAGINARFQFLRQGYFSVDPDSTPDKPVFNRIVSLKDSWSKIEKKK